jgi:hypothetical protein
MLEEVALHILPQRAAIRGADLAWWTAPSRPTSALRPAAVGHAHRTVRPRTRRDLEDVV